MLSSQFHGKVRGTLISTACGYHHPTRVMEGIVKNSVDRKKQGSLGYSTYLLTLNLWHSPFERKFDLKDECLEDKEPTPIPPTKAPKAG